MSDRPTRREPRGRPSTTARAPATWPSPPTDRSTARRRSHRRDLVAPRPLAAAPLLRSLRRRRAAPAHPAHLHARLADAVGLPRRHDLRAGALEPHRAARLGQPPGRLQPRPGRAARAALGAADERRGRAEQLRQLGVQRRVIYYNGTWSAGISRFGAAGAARRRCVDDVLEDDTPSRMITEVGGETVMVFGIPLPELGAYFEFFDLERGRPHAVQRRPVAAPGQRHHDAARRAARRVRRPPRRAARWPRRRRRPRRSPAATSAPACRRRRPRPRRARRLVQRHGVGAAAAHRARRPLRLRRQPRAALAADDAVGVGRGDGGPPPRACPSGPRPRSTCWPATSAASRGSSRTSSRSAASTPARSGCTSRSCRSPSSCATPWPSARRRRRRWRPPTRAERAVIRGDRRRLARVARQPHRQRQRLRRRRAGGHDRRRQPADEPLTHVQIAVEDHGPGVPVEERALIFERFARGATAGGAAAARAPASAWPSSTSTSASTAGGCGSRTVSTASRAPGS